MEEQNSKTIRYSEEVKKIDVAPVLSLKPRINRRGVSLGPAEIASTVKSRPSNKPIYHSGPVGSEPEEILLLETPRDG